MNALKVRLAKLQVRIFLRLAKIMRWVYHRALTSYVERLVKLIHATIRLELGQEAADLYLKSLEMEPGEQPVAMVPKDLADEIHKSQLGRKVVKIPEA